MRALLLSILLISSNFASSQKNESLDSLFTKIRALCGDCLMVPNYYQIENPCEKYRIFNCLSPATHVPDSGFELHFRFFQLKAVNLCILEEYAKQDSVIIRRIISKPNLYQYFGTPAGKDLYKALQDSSCPDIPPSLEFLSDIQYKGLAPQDNAFYLLKFDSLRSAQYIVTKCKCHLDDFKGERHPSFAFEIYSNNQKTHMIEWIEWDKLKKDYKIIVRHFQKYFLKKAF